jgi:hypothetical protein
MGPTVPQLLLLSAPPRVARSRWRPLDRANGRRPDECSAAVTITRSPSIRSLLAVRSGQHVGVTE